MPIFIHYFLNQNFKLALLTLVVASLTDMIDGFLARHCHMGTTVGAVLDPLADKFLMLVSFLVLSAYRIQPGTEKIIPVWLACVVIGRDFYIIFGMMYLYFVKKLALAPKPTLMSKRTTFFQFLLLAFSFLKVYLLSKPDVFSFICRESIFRFQFALIFITAIFTLYTFVEYTSIGLKVLKLNIKRKDII